MKKRILEYLAVRKLAPGKKGPILCLAGPPGVGKTSLGKSIARSLGREFIRVSLGGVRDEAEIRGHRRTYIGALPGRIIQGMRRVGSRNPVFMLDEIDKLGADFRGDPSAALLEVLDPEQNSTFSDHYLEVTFDLSNVIFIATANMLDPIPPALLDRMEVLEIPGYTREEKLEIAKRHLVPKQVAEHGLDRRADQAVERRASTTVIEQYTREAGVRNLEREVASVIRGDRRQGGGEPALRSEPDPRTRSPISSARRSSTRKRPSGPRSRAWPPASPGCRPAATSSSSRPRAMTGKGDLILTGQLGDVMKESARAGLSWVRTHVEELGITTDFEKADIHLHVPAGAVSKDGPSAGVAITTALVSLLTGRRVRGDVAMTGEITLRGTSCPSAASRRRSSPPTAPASSGSCCPERNRKDIVDIPETVRKELELVFVKKIDEALELTLEAVPVVVAGPGDPAPGSETAARA